MAKDRKNYINNEEFLEEIIKCKKADKISDKLVKMMYQIANQVSASRNFINYTYKDEMIQESVTHALFKALPNYDVERKNPFGFFSTVIIYKFIEIIKKENKFIEVKNTLKQIEEDRIEQDIDTRI